MHVVKLENCNEFLAGDETLLKEIIVPKRDKLELSYSLSKVVLPPGKSSLPHILKSSEVYHVLSGKAKLIIDNELRIILPSDTAYIPPNALQYLINDFDEPFVFLAIVDPAWFKENEIVFRI